MRERVCVTFRGLMLEKFLMRALSNGVRIDAVRRTGPRDAMIETNEAGARALLALGERFSLAVGVCARRGAGVWREKLRRRWTLPAFMALCALLTALLLSRVWIVDVQAPGGRVNERAVRDAVKAAGVVYGSSMRDVNAEALALDIRLRVPDLVYASVKKRGVRLLVEAVSAYAAPDVYNPAAARDLVSAADALVVRVNALAGTPAVKPGDVVRKGQVLIRGEERDGRETTRGVCALGTVEARVWFTGEAESAVRIRRLQPTGRTRASQYLTLPGYSLPITQEPPFDLETLQTRQTVIGGLFVPLHMRSVEHIELESRETVLQEDALRARIGTEALNAALARAPGGVSPVDKRVDYSMIEEERIRARATVEYRLNVAVARTSELK